jgi:NO-binding membrane sensor protein with MHYT domain/GAF domain-containing protein
MLEFLLGFLHSQHQDPILPHAHDPWLVALSVAIAILASYTALDLASQVAAARGRARVTWLLGGAVAMGTGIWSMHFVAMLAFQLPIPVKYDVLLVTVSWLAAVVASCLSLALISRQRVSWRQLVPGGLLMGAAISGMHYIGMAAIRLQGFMHLEPIPFGLSIFIAVVASTAALWLQFRLRAAVTRAEQVWKALAAVVMGFAIASMHYTGMFGSVFHADTSLPANPPGAVEITLLGGIAIALGAFLVLGLTLLVSVLARGVRHLTYARKFMLISLVFFIAPAGAFAPLVWQQVLRIEQYGYNELYGTYYLRPLHAIVYGLQSHQWTEEDFRTGAATITDLDRTIAQVDQGFQALEALHQEYGAQLGLTNEAAALKARWETLKAGSRSLSLSRTESALEHGALIASLRQLILQVGDTSYLILDPDLDTYYMMDAVLLKLPDSQALLDQIVTLSRRVVANGQFTVIERANLTSIISLLRANVEGLDRNTTTSLRNNPAGTMAPIVADPHQAYLKAVQDMLRLIQTRLLNPVTLESEELASAVNDLLPLVERARSANTAIYAADSLALEVGIQARIANLTTQLVVALVIALIGLALASGIGLRMIQGLSRPLSAMTQAAQRLQAGDLAIRVPVTTEDEVGQLGLAFNQMAEGLQATQRRLATSAEVSRRLSVVIDHKQLMEEVVAQVQTAFHYYHAQIYLFDAAREHLVMAGGTGEAGQIMLAQGHKLPAGHGLVGKAASTNAPVVVPDTHQDPNWLPNPLLPDTRSEVAVPITLGGEVLGVLDVQDTTANRLTQDDAQLLQALADQIAIALQNARLYAATRAKAERASHVNVIAQKIQTATSLEGVLRIAARELGQTLQARRAVAQLGLEQSENGRN